MGAMLKVRICMHVLDLLHQYVLRFRSHSGLLYEQIEMEKRKKSKIFEVFHKPRNIYQNRYNFSINIESDLSS